MIVLVSCVHASPPNITPTSLSNEWRTGMSYRGSDEVLAFLRSTENSPSTYNQTVISVSFILLTRNSNSKIACQDTPLYNSDNISININLGNQDAKNYNYTFDNSRVWLTSREGVRYHLQPTGSKSNIFVPFQVYNLTERRVLRNGATIHSSNRAHHFKTPLLCEALEGAIFELRGLYRDGMELPPLKFRINYK
jgi:hypothetical protein